jgi:hypothetical protein
MSAQLDKMKSLLAQLGDNSGLSIPGLDTNSVTENLASKNSQLQSLINETEDPAQKKAIKDRYVSEIRPYVQEQITIIKMTYKDVKEGVKNVIDSVSVIIAAALVPPALPAGPNPAYVILDGKQKLAFLTNSLATLLNSYRQMLQAAINIQFELPDTVLDLGKALSNAQRALNTIPV